MDSLIAKGNAVQPTTKKHRKSDKNKETKSKDNKVDPTLHSIEHHSTTPRSLRQLPKGSANPHKHIRDKKLRAHLAKQSQHSLLSKELIDEVEDDLFVEDEPGKLEVEGEMERTWRVTQNEIAKSVDAESSRMRRDVKLDGGPYRCRYTRNGR